ncbi:MAG: DNA-3-methyladenine glycosylase [Ignavibacteria bacterium]|nr:DNA-3-methyladenine glycosylase [Ignavibacteria bacterium]
MKANSKTKDRDEQLFKSKINHPRSKNPNPSSLYSINSFFSILHLIFYKLLADKSLPLKRKFYLQDTLTVSKELLGKIIVRKTGGKILTAKIVETEAYFGDHDPACHAYRKITERNKIMYETGGMVYVYFIYGNYYCLNVVCEDKGIGNAVLIRAAEPLKGINEMKKLRGPVKNDHELANGPAKLCLSLNIDKSLYGEDLTTGKNIFISKPSEKEKFNIVVTKRIGLNVGVDLPYRFFIKDNPYVTKHKFNN